VIRDPMSALSDALAAAGDALIRAARLLAEHEATTSEDCPPVVLPIKAWAARMGIPTGTLRQWAQRGQLTGSVKVGKRWLIPATAFGAMVPTIPTPQDGPGASIPHAPVHRPTPPRSRPGTKVDLGAWRHVRKGGA